MLPAIRTPAENDRRPRYMEKAVAAIHQGNRVKSAIELLYRVYEQRVGLWLRFPDSLADVVMAAVEAS